MMFVVFNQDNTGFYIFQLSNKIGLESIHPKFNKVKKLHKISKIHNPKELLALGMEHSI